MVVAISTGCCYDLKLSKLESVHFLEKYPIDGVELLFATPEQLTGFELDEKALSFLKRLEFVSIHMPFENINYNKNQETQQLISKANSIAKQVNAQYLVFHPNTVKDFDSIKNNSLKVCIENLNKKESGYQTVEEIQTILKEHAFLEFVLDIAHVFGNNLNLNDFLKLNSKLNAIHVSGQWIKKGNLKEHGFLTEGTNEQLEKIKPILRLKKPKVIESDFYPYKIPLIEKEIQLLREFDQTF
ncbi:MAG: TIM barrel protein [archaeon]|jgi:endonuclease IV